METNAKKKVLFDTGQSGLFYQNAVKMGVDLSQVEIVVISHGHYDHTGGLVKFLEINNNALIYIREEALQTKTHKGRYIGMPKEILAEAQSNGRVIYTKDSVTPLTSNLSIISTPVRDLPQMAGFYTEEQGLLGPDLFKDEQYLVYDHGGGTTLITGCSHKGIVSIIEDCEAITGTKVLEVAGGLHTSGSSAGEVSGLSAKLLKTSIQKFAAGHCTGIESYAVLKSILGERIFYNYTGNRFNFQEK
jgi:7,8-dihydropterin-6-yl-methyl-4-(beta-D-ribofuranosyl)aminobenzene 5'-phosphate synthase